MPVGGRASIGRRRKQATVLRDGAGELDLTATMIHKTADIIIGINYAIIDIVQLQLNAER